MNSWSPPLGGSAKTATRMAIPLCTRSAASRAPAPAELADMTMMSAGAIGSLTTSAHPAARKIGSRREGTVAIAANAANTKIQAHLPRWGLILRFMASLRKVVLTVRLAPKTISRLMPARTIHAAPRLDTCGSKAEIPLSANLPPDAVQLGYSNPFAIYSLRMLSRAFHGRGL